MPKTSGSGKKFNPASVSQNIVPTTDATYTLGSSTKAWLAIYAIALIVTTITVTTLNATDITTTTLNATRLADDMNLYQFNLTNGTMVSFGSTPDAYIHYNGSALILANP